MCHLKTLEVKNGTLQRRETSSCASFLELPLLEVPILIICSRELVSTMKLMPAKTQWMVLLVCDYTRSNITPCHFRAMSSLTLYHLLRLDASRSLSGPPFHQTNLWYGTVRWRRFVRFRSVGGAFFPKGKGPAISVPPAPNRHHASWQHPAVFNLKDVMKRNWGDEDWWWQPTLSKTNKSHLKNGWFGMEFLLKWPILRAYVSFWGVNLY